MTDDGQAQNSLHANSSNCAGHGVWWWWWWGGETGVLTSLDFTVYRFCNDKTLSDPPSAWYAFLAHLSRR